MEKLKIIPPDAQIYAQVKASWDKIAKPLDGLGQFETMFAQIGAITGSSSLSIEKKVILTMCADNGIVAEGVSQSGQEVTAVVAGFMGQQASSVGKMARRAGVDVIPVDIGINTKETLPGVRDCKVMQGTRDFLQEPAMTEEEALQALSVGIDLVRECKDKGYQLIGTGEMGIGNTTTSSMLVAALTGRTGRATTEHLHFEVRVNGQHFNPNLVFDLQERKLNNQCLVFTQKGGKIAVKPVELMPHQFAGDYSYSPASCKNKEQIESKKETL